MIIAAKEEKMQPKKREESLGKAQIKIAVLINKLKPRKKKAL